MKAFILFFVLLSAQVFSQDVGYHWVNTINSSAEDAGYAMESDLEGNIYMTGSFTDTIRIADSVLISEGSSDAFLAKFNPNGDLLWYTTIGGHSEDKGLKIDFDQDNNVLLAGLFHSAAVLIGDTILSSCGCWEFTFFAKFSPDGDLFWARGITGEGAAIVSDIKAGLDNSVYVLGRYNLDTYFGNDTIYTVGSMDIFLAKYTSDGNYQWVEHYGSVNEDNALRMDMFSNGDLLLTGFFNKRIEFREDTIYSNGADDLFLTRLLPNGEPVWSLNAGGIGNDRANSVFIDKNDNILLTGQYEIGAYFEDFYLESMGYMDAFLAKYNQDGNLVWTKGFNGSIYEQGSDVAADDNGNIYLSAWFISEVSIGDTMLTTNSLYDSFILKTDSDGNTLWIEQITGPGDEKVLSLSVTGNDSLYFTGVYTDTVFINNDTLTNKGWNDLFYTRMLPEIILESPLAVNASELITFYPNPASNQFFIEIEHPSIIYLHDISGKAIQQFEFYKDGFIDVSGIKNGLYFLTVQSDRSKKTEKLIIKH